MRWLVLFCMAGTMVHVNGCAFTDNSKLKEAVSAYIADNATYHSDIAQPECENVPINNWDVSAVTDMSTVFFNAITFNEDIGGWDTSSVNDMNHMFFAATSFNQSIGGWDTSSVEYMNYMFAGANAFNRDINTKSATDLNGNPYTAWDTSGVIFMHNMFREANAFDQDINDWTTSSVTEMTKMFYKAKEFNQPLCDWDVSNVGNNHLNFATDSPIAGRNYFGWENEASEHGQCWCTDSAAANYNQTSADNVCEYHPDTSPPSSSSSGLSTGALIGIIAGGLVVVVGIYMLARHKQSPIVFNTVHRIGSLIF